MVVAAKSFLRNYLTKYQVGTEKADVTFKTLGSGIKEVAQSAEEDAEDVPYYDLEGGKETIFSGITGIYTVTGDRDYGDEAQNFIRAKLYDSEDRKLYLKITEPNGAVVEGFATVGEIVAGGGEASKRGAFGCTLKFIGKPEETPAV